MDVIHGAKSVIGHALRPLHAGSEKLLSYDKRLAPRNPAILLVQTPAIDDNGTIPRKYSGEGENISPPLRWSGVPEGTRELLLFCEDPDAPMIEPYIHWILYSLPPDRTSLPEAVPTTAVVPSLGNARQGKNSSGTIGYTGPMPPVGHGIHHYHFQLFALDEPIRLGNDPDRKQLIAAMSSHILAIEELIGTYERR